MTTKWVKYSNHQGVRINGINKYEPKEPWGPWTKILGVVSRCEGAHDTFINYDGTGATWGFMQWTFTSGRLQKLLEFFKSVPHYILSTDEDEDLASNLFDSNFTDFQDGEQIFEEFGFSIIGGKFFSLIENDFIIPRSPKERKMISDTCLGKYHHDKFKDQKAFTIKFAERFASIGSFDDIALAQVLFAKNEFQNGLSLKRKRLNNFDSIENLLKGTWNTPIPAIFYNLWQNSPMGASRLFINAYKDASHERGVVDFNGQHYYVLDAWSFLDYIWNRLSKTKFANWSYHSKNVKSGVVRKPRIYRIQKAIDEFYDIKLKLEK
jgi:hypothetical protein